MMKKYLSKIVFTLCGVMSFYVLSPQQDPQYSQYMFHKFVYNPAVAGSDDAVSSTLLLRNQWIDFDGHPMTQTFSTHFPINPISSGMGLHFVNDVIGAERTTNIMVSLAYILRLKFGNISIGASGGFIKKSLDGEKLRSPQGDYVSGSFDHRDTEIPSTLKSDNATDLSAGIYFKGKKLDFGFSATHLIAPKITYDAGTGKDIVVTQVKNYYITAGYMLPLATRLDLKPSFKVKTDETKTQVDLNALFVYRKNLWAGLSYRGFSSDNNDAMVAVAGLNLTSNLIFGYSYDITTSALRGAGSGSHEFMLNYKFTFAKPPKPEKIIYCPRYL